MLCRLVRPPVFILSLPSLYCLHIVGIFSHSFICFCFFLKNLFFVCLFVFLLRFFAYVLCFPLSRTLMLPISHSALKVLKATHYPLYTAQRDDGRWNPPHIGHVTAPLSWLCGQKKRIPNTAERAIVKLSIQKRRYTQKREKEKNKQAIFAAFSAFKEKNALKHFLYRWIKLTTLNYFWIITICLVAG